jgi:hypothetical protein
MPVISRFYGISILMFFKDHAPPHFHAKYEGKIAVYNIKTREIIAGDIPPHAKKLVKEWLKLHQPALMGNWNQGRKDGGFKPIDPLL